MVRKSSSGRLRSNDSGRVKLVAGEWGGRYITFEEAEGLRPTGGRIRETLFNWLQVDIVGARVLDLFAGSGALGFEAASRSAAHVDMVELHPATLKNLCKQVEAFGATTISLHQCSARDFLLKASLRYDVVFLDPPFHGDLMAQSLKGLFEKEALLDGSLLYLEFERKNAPVLPEKWVFERLKEANDVGYGLIRIRSS